MTVSWREPLLFLVLTAILVWPALINDGPILFFDTIAYLNAGSTAVEKLIGYDLRTFYRPEDLAAASSADVLQKTPVEGADPSPDTANASRSIYYALFLLTLVKVGGLWSVPLVQAAIFAAALTAFLAAWLPGRPWTAAAIGIVTAGAGAAPFFTSYLMPDFLSGLAILAMLRLMLPPPLASRLEGLAWAALLYLALVAHLSHLMVAIGLFFCACLVVPLAQLSWPRGGSVLVVSVLVLAVVSELLFSYTVSRTFGQPPLRPPFVAARMIEDGPGQRLLEEVCPPIPVSAPLAAPITYETPPRFELCRYRHRLPETSLIILWSPDPERGIYATADPASRARLSDEHFAFAAAVMARFPLAQSRAAIARFSEQMRGFSLTEFPYTDGMRAKLDTRLAADLQAEVAATRFYAGSFPIDPANALTQATTMVGAVALAVLFAVSFRARTAGAVAAEQRTLRALAVLILLGLIGNAAVTGILSAPHDRYQARVCWLVLLAAGILAAGVCPERRSKDERDGATLRGES